jgi:hypothetical protein
MLRLLEKQCEFVVCWQRMVVSGVAGTVLGWQLAGNWGEMYEVERTLTLLLLSRGVDWGLD